MTACHGSLLFTLLQGVEQARDDYRDVQSRIDSAQLAAESTLTTAKHLQLRAEALNTEAQQVSLQELLGRQSYVYLCCLVKHIIATN